MPVSIVSNAAASYAQRAMQVRNDNIIISTQKLTSGQRVFSVDEDPAALAVGSGLKIENAALNSARLNVASGVSMLQVADGALGQMNNVLVRMQTLATQAASGHLADSERVIINGEFLALRTEIDRLAADTEFNGVAMLAGTTGYNLEGAHAFSVDGVSNLTFDPTAFLTDGVVRYSYDSATEQLTLSRIDGGSVSTQIVDLTALLDAVAGVGQNMSAGESLTVTFSGVGASLTLGPAFDRGADILPTVTDNSGVDVAFGTPPVWVPATTGLTLSGVNGNGTTGGLQGLGSAYNAATGDVTLAVDTDGTAVVLGGVAGLRYSVNGGAFGAGGAASANLVTGAAAYVDVQVSDGSGGWMGVGRMTMGAVTTAGTTDGTLVLSLGQGVVGADLQGTPGGTTLTYKVGTGILAGQDTIAVTIPAVTVGGLGLASTEVNTKVNANNAIDSIKAALNVLNSARATVGAQQSRLEAVGSNLGVIIENNTSAASALLDTDASEELTNIATDQAMLQLGISMLSRANQLPDLILQLLRNS